MWVECLDCNAETEDFGNRIHFPATAVGYSELRAFLRRHERSHNIDCYVADYKDDDGCPLCA